MEPRIIDGNYWRRRAEEARVMGREMTTAFNQEAMQTLAEQYDRLAAEADCHDDKASPEPPSDHDPTSERRRRV